jgi:LPS-assembly protein
VIISPVLKSSEVFDIQIGEQVRVISDQAFRLTSENYFEAVGNVIITHLNNAIYGEKATLSFESGQADVIGNVRYVGPAMTLHGSKLTYNFKSQTMTALNARIISDNYTLVGSKIERIGTDLILAEDAEYTTCRDCPESWSVYGKRVRIILGEYIYITHAYLKMKGVVMFYAPYIVLPIKKNRETGFLFPSFGLKLDEGVRLQLPWFWAISDQNDLTLTPSLWGKRGLLNEFEYRHVFGEKKWLSFNSLQSRDRIYQPFKAEQELSGETVLRHFSDYEHHVSIGNWFNHHFFGNFARDLDMIRDFERFNADRLQGPELGMQTFFNVRFPRFDFNLQASMLQNQLVQQPRDFDHSYVQILPRLSMTQNPIDLVHTQWPLINRVTFGGDYEYTYFTQNHFNENDIIRNAHRFNLNPFIDWRLGYIGPIALKTRATWDIQSYRFPYEQKKSFNKRTIVYETEASLELERVFGLAYQDTVQLSDVNLDMLSEEEIKNLTERSDKDQIDQLNAGLIGGVPLDLYATDNETLSISRNAFRHGMEFKLKHYYLGDQQTQGNQRFLNQIQTDAGQFDSVDSLRERQSFINDGNSRTDIPLGNSIEIQWNNNLIQKSANRYSPFEDQRLLKDNFSYATIASFNVSQGLDLTVDSSEDLRRRLTRLYVGTGFSLGGYSFSLADYYFWANDSHLFYGSVGKSFGALSLTGSLVYNAFSRPIYKTVITNADFRLNDLISFRAYFDYDLQLKSTNRTTYGVTYSPTNNCWMLDLAFSTTQIEKSISFNFLFNFNDNNFTGMSRP